MSNFRMNVERIESRIACLKRNRDQCKCEGPGCTMLREEMTKLIGVYERLRLNMLEAIQLSEAIAAKLAKPTDKKCK